LDFEDIPEKKPDEEDEEFDSRNLGKPIFNTCTAISI